MLQTKATSPAGLSLLPVFFHVSASSPFLPSEAKFACCLVIITALRLEEEGAREVRKKGGALTFLFSLAAAFDSPKRQGPPLLLLLSASCLLWHRTWGCHLETSPVMVDNLGIRKHVSGH